MNKKKVITGGIGLLCLAGLIGGGVWYSNNNETAKKRAELEQKLQNSAEGSTVNVELPTENQSAGVYEIKNTSSNEAVDDKLYTKLASLNNAVQNYYEKNYNDLLCIYGLMYSDKDNYSVSASKIAKEAQIDLGDNLDDYADILLIRPSDLAEIDGIELKRSNDTNLKPFTAYNSSSGYIISSADDKGGIITRNQYKALLGTYATDHGSVKNPTPTEEIYLDISATVAVEFGESSYDLKYIANDDKYAVAIIGSTIEPNKIKEYVLEKKPGGWSVVMSDIESLSNPRQKINSTVPDMELGLLPKYNIAQFGEIKTGFVEYEQALIKLGMITEEDMPETYSCGTGRFAYIETKSGKKLLGYVNDEKKLEFYEVKSTNEAIAAMLQLQDTPPVFILHYNQTN